MTTSDPTDHTVTSLPQLEAIVGVPNRRAATKVRPRLADVHREWIAASPFLVLSTVDADGRVDASTKGDPAGFVHVIDEHTIAVPERPGNRRVDGYRNILETPRAGTLFLVPGRGDTLRVNGRARIVADAPYFDDMAVQGKRPILAVEIAVEEVFFHCAKAFLRSHLWDTDTWDPDALPSPAEIAHTISGDDIDELRRHYSDENYRSLLY